jgi:hypothetical protein
MSYYFHMIRYIIEDSRQMISQFIYNDEIYQDIKHRESCENNTTFK